MLVAAGLVFVTSLNHKKQIVRIDCLPLVKAITGLLMACAIAYEAFASSLLKYATPTQSLLHRFAAALSVSAFIYMAFCCFTKKSFPKIITAVPLLFWLTRVITVFTEFAALATVTDTVIETITMCLCLFVFLDDAKLECDLKVRSKKLTRAIALLCSYAGLISALPRIVCAFAVPEAFGYFANIPPFTSLAAAVYAAVLALTLKPEPA